MNKPAESNVSKAVDSIQERLTSYACQLDYSALSSEAIHVTKVRVIDTLGALIAGFFADPSRIARNVAVQMPDPAGATIIGTRLKTTPDMAAFVNSGTARYIELTDSYHWPGSFGGHPSDVITPVLAAGEHAQISGREFINGIVLAYEVYLRINDIFQNTAFDHTNFALLGSAVGAGKVLGLSSSQLSHCISMAAVPNVILAQLRKDHLSMFKAIASGQAGRAGVFAALLARAGMEGPHLPFEGKAGWCDHVALKRFSLDIMGGEGTSFKIQDTSIKLLPSAGTTHAAVLAAERVVPFKNFRDVKQITVEVYQFAKQQVGTGEQRWNPQSKETADHSIPYLVAVMLMDGTLTPSSFNDAHLWNPELRALMQKIEVVENAEFTRAYGQKPVEHRARVTVVNGSGERLVGESGGQKDDLAAPKSDAQIEKKFRELTEDFLGTNRATAILDRLWHLEKLERVSDIPPMFAVA